MYVDAHNHFDSYKENLPKALDIINKEKILSLGCSMDLKTYLFTKKISKKNPYIIPCFGIHPWEAHKHYNDLDMYDNFIKECKLVGEIGLDYFWVDEKEKYPYMIEVFNYFLDRCKKYNKIANIHTKGAEEEIYKNIVKYNLKSPIIHWYSGDFKTLKKFLEYGCYFTISVDIDMSELTREIVKLVPLNKMLTETDGPNSMEWINGKYGYPSDVKHIVHEISKIKKLPLDEVKNMIFQNLKFIIK